ncbi:hypothetical protein NLJ89_g12060 [Agrocybe chaxingu]|uniref:DEAD/DEAH box helicase domain-containing protein n=1 Tax=Agrocybe chaxingu TaxID=84603 RepID=A0A9W8JV59_9AGAR|nr:hypothetical protein NLJ89_g12060 [Agrocybe chaxingu]
MVAPEPAGLSSPEGLQLARELLRPKLPHDIHDYILEGICKAIDGAHILCITKTGGGKTGYFYGYILLLKALEKMDPPCALLKSRHPTNPAMVIVFPTKGLEEEMEVKFRAFGISALAINEDTLATARRSKRNLWQECIKDVDVWCGCRKIWEGRMGSSYGRFRRFCCSSTIEFMFRVSVLVVVCKLIHEHCFFPPLRLSSMSKAPIGPAHIIGDHAAPCRSSKNVNFGGLPVSHQ